MAADKYNASHKKDMTAYKAFRNIDRGIKKTARKLFWCLLDFASMAGFDIILPLRLRHKKTGSRIDMADKEDADV